MESEKQKMKRLANISEYKLSGSVKGARGTLIFYKRDFKNETVWRNLLEELGIPAGEEIGFREISEVHVKYNAVDYDIA